LQNLYGKKESKARNSSPIFRPERENFLRLRDLLSSQKDHILHGLHRSYAGPSSFSTALFENIISDGPYENGTVIPYTIDEYNRKYIYIDDASTQNNKNQGFNIRKVFILSLFTGIDGNVGINRVESKLYELFKNGSLQEKYF
jgi:hypothetical protein